MNELEKLKAENAALHIALAGAQLHARLGWERYEAANRARHNLETQLMELNSAKASACDHVVS